MDQVEAAVLLGLIQSTLTDFEPSLFRELKKNTIEEGLLGVSLTGLMDDSVFLSDSHGIEWLREYAHECAAKWSHIMGIPCPTAITCVKPSGTVSKLVGCSPGIHPRFSRYYLSNVGVSKDTPLCKFLLSQGVPIRVTLDSMVVFSFPLAAPEGAIVADDLSALEHLRMWALVNEHWCDHNASCTIYVGPDEWTDVQAWCHQNLSSIAGVTFLSRFESTGGSYMPLERLTRDEYGEAAREFPMINWKEFHLFDNGEDTSAREYACTGGSCELIVP